MPRINVQTEMPALPERRVPIYKLKTPDIDVDAVSGWARHFKLKGRMDAGSFCHDADKITYSEGPFDLTVFRASGGIRIKDRTRWQVDDGKSDVKTSDEVAIKLGRQRVSALKLAPPNEFELLKVTRLHAGSSRPDGKEAEERVVDLGVCFQRTVGHIPVDGPGGKIVVYMDQEGKMTGTDVIWRTLAGVHKQAKLRSPESVLPEIETRYGKGENGKVEVYGMRFGYFEGGWKDQQRYLQPAYVALLRLISQDERLVMRSAYVAPAATEPVGVLTPPAPKNPRQQSRKA